MKPIEYFECIICPTKPKIQGNALKQHHTQKHSNIPFEERSSKYKYIYSIIYNFECKVCHLRVEKPDRSQHRRRHLRADPKVEIRYDKMVTKIAEKMNIKNVRNTRSTRRNRLKYTSTQEEVEMCLAKWSASGKDAKWVTCNLCSCQVDRQFFAQHIVYEHPESKAEILNRINQGEMDTEVEQPDGGSLEVKVADDDKRCEAIYSISVSHSELQKFLQQHRIYKHEGRFFLKNSD